MKRNNTKNMLLLSQTCIFILYGIQITYFLDTALHYLFKIDTLAAWIWSSNNLHKAMLVSRECVIWNKVINTQLLQGMSPSLNLEHSLCCQYWAYVVVLLGHQGQCNQADLRQQGTHLSNPRLSSILTRYIEQHFQSWFRFL